MLAFMTYRFTALVFAAFLVMQCGAGAAAHRAGASTPPPDLLSLVDPFLGTGTGMPGYNMGNEGGHVFPGAAYPRGMVQWSPDTTAGAGGYRFTQHLINGFSLTHFSGRGCSAYQDFPIMPTTTPVTTSPAVNTAYSAPFSHADEAASPGYYHVAMPTTGIAVDLTVTPRTGLGQFSFPRGGTGTILVRAGGSATGNRAQGTGVKIVNSTTISGSATSGAFCGSANTYTVYLAAEFNQPFAAYGVWDGAAIQSGVRQATGAHTGAYLSFDTARHAGVTMKVGISFVSVANAFDNLHRESPGWDFGAVRRAAAAAWSAALSRIRIGGGTHEQRVVFYTALYHTQFHPNIFSDANGQYLGFDRRVHLAQGFIQYENFPGWDMYRSLIGLDALLEPATVRDMIISLTNDAAQGGGGLPRWQVASDNSGGMVGDSQDAVIATAHALGVTGFDEQAALAAMVRGASDPTARAGPYAPREGLADYLRLGYVPGSASISLEYAVDDFAIAQFAAALGSTAVAQRFQTRARGWRLLWDPTVGAVEPRNADGSFLDAGGLTNQDGFTEGDSAQYTWLIPMIAPGSSPKWAATRQRFGDSTPISPS